MIKRIFHTILGVISAVVLTVVIVPLVLSILLSNITIQNLAVDYLSNKITKQIGTRVEIGHIAVKFFNRVELKDVFVEDYQKAIKLNPALKSVDDADVLMILKI